MATIKGYTWNCGGLRANATASRSKAIFFEKEFGNKFDCFFFVETHHKTMEEIPEEILRYDNTHHIIDSPTGEEETHAGIIGLISKDYEIISKKDIIQGRICNVKIRHQIEKSDHNITIVYMETNNHITKDKIQNIVRKLRLENEDHSNNILLGDFNFIDHEKDKKNGLNNTDKLVAKTWQPFFSRNGHGRPFSRTKPQKTNLVLYRYKSCWKQWKS